MANLEESIKVDKLKRSIHSQKVSSDFINLSVTDTDQVQGVINASGGSRAVLFVATLSNNNNLRVFGIPNATVYKDSVSKANIIPQGQDENNIDIPVPGGGTPQSYLVSMWMDWGTSDNNNLKYKIFVSKGSVVLGADIDVICRVNWRVLFEDVNTSLTVTQL